ncbi:hypothetical protein AAG570_001521 [Ranatra chinensis]|uniref:Uncharacterized protein n=1 Tax=Ranatra chinensis TaxID=642074 RepID=A0ABD0YRD2_9HEMI
MVAGPIYRLNIEPCLVQITTPGESLRLGPNLLAPASTYSAITRLPRDDGVMSIFPISAHFLFMKEVDVIGEILEIVYILIGISHIFYVEMGVGEAMAFNLINASPRLYSLKKYSIFSLYIVIFAALCFLTLQPGMYNDSIQAIIRFNLGMLLVFSLLIYIYSIPRLVTDIEFMIGISPPKPFIVALWTLPLICLGLLIWLNRVDKYRGISDLLLYLLAAFVFFTVLFESIKYSERRREILYAFRGPKYMRGRGAFHRPGTVLWVIEISGVPQHKLTLREAREQIELLLTSSWRQPS